MFSVCCSVPNRGPGSPRVELRWYSVEDSLEKQLLRHVWNSKHCNNFILHENRIRGTNNIVVNGYYLILYGDESWAKGASIVSTSPTHRNTESQRMRGSDVLKRFNLHHVQTVQGTRAHMTSRDRKNARTHHDWSSWPKQENPWPWKQSKLFKDSESYPDSTYCPPSTHRHKSDKS